MAKFLSQVVTIMRGSVGGITYTANQFHQLIARARTAPVQPNTTPQTQIKQAFTDAENLWETLAAGIQNDWDSYADRTPYSGPLGPYSVTGRLMFHGVLGLVLYMNSTMAAGISVDTSSPGTPGFAQMPIFTIGPPTSPEIGIRLSATIPLGADGLSVMGQRSDAFTSTRKRYKGPWNSSTNQSVDFLAGVSTDIDFLGLVVGDIHFIHLRAVVTTGPHRIATDLIFRAEAVAGII